MTKTEIRATIYLTGSQKNITRTIWTDGSKFFVIWGGAFIEVANVYGDRHASAGWRSVDLY